MKVLVIAVETIGQDDVDALVDEADEVRVMSPALSGSALRFWLNDTDDAIEHAQEAVEASAEKLDVAGVDVSTDAVTDDEPTVAIDDALRALDPDRVIVVKHSPDDEHYLEGSLLETLAEHTTAPIDVREVSPR